jgi:23S rRNA pseudouridine955/2504/2580 synthase
MKIEIGTNEAGQRVDKFLRKWLKDVPLSAIYKDLRKGNIKVNGKKVKEKYSLQQGDIVELINVKFKNEKKNFKRVENSFLKITYEDENILALEKWPGVLVHANSKNGDATLTDYVLSYLHDKGDYLPENEVTFTPAACNRLDRNTSGIVLFGKNYESLKLLNEMIREKNIDKYYYALVKDRIKDGNYRAYIEKDSVNNK